MMVQAIIDGDVKKGTTVRDRVVTRSISVRNTAKPKPKPRKKRAMARETPKDKLYEIPLKKHAKDQETVKDEIEIPGNDGFPFSNLTPEEYAAFEKEEEEFLSNAHLKKPPGYAKQQSDWLCHQYFPIIQEGRKEMANYVLVEPMGLIVILVWGCWAHVNFKAKHKDADDSTTAIYFAEIDVPNKEVTNLTKLDMDLSTDTGAYKQCMFCHRDPEKGKHLSIGGYGCVYHPVDCKLVLS